MIINGFGNYIEKFKVLESSYCNKDQEMFNIAKTSSYSPFVSSYLFAFCKLATDVYLI